MPKQKLNEQELIELIVKRGLRNMIPPEDVDEAIEHATLTHAKFELDKNFIEARVIIKSFKGQADMHFGCIEIVFDEDRDRWVLFFDGHASDEYEYAWWDWIDGMAKICR